MVTQPGHAACGLLQPDVGKLVFLIEPALIVLARQVAQHRLAVVGAGHDDVLQLEAVHQVRRLRGDEDLALFRQTLEHLSHQGDGVRVQAQLRLVEEHHVRQTVGRQVQQRQQGEQAQRSIRREVRTEHLVALLAHPAQQHLAGFCFQHKVLERRQHPANLLDDQLVAFAVAIAQVEQHGREVAAVRTQAERLGDVPAVVNGGVDGCVVKLIDGALTQKVDDGLARLALLLQQAGLFSHPFNLGPLRLGRDVMGRIPIGFVHHHHGIASRDVGQIKPILVVARCGFKAQLGMDARGLAHPHEELVITAAMAQHELLQVLGLEHPAQHLEEADQGGLACAVGPDEHGELRQLQVLDVLQATEAFDGDRFDAAGLRRFLLSRWGPKLGHHTSSTLNMRSRNSGSIWRSLSTLYGVKSTTCFMQVHDNLESCFIFFRHVDTFCDIWPLW